jgi:hypothetical protein
MALLKNLALLLTSKTNIGMPRLKKLYHYGFSLVEKFFFRKRLKEKSFRHGKCHLRNSFVASFSRHA